MFKGRRRLGGQDAHQPPPWPPLDASAAEVLERRLDRFFQTRTVEEAWEAAREILSCMPQAPGARGAALHMPWEIWAWFVVAAEGGVAVGRPLTPAKLAVFADDWHDRFVPNSGQSWMILDKASVDQRRAIDEAAVSACYKLGPNVVVRSPHDVSIRELQDRLSRRLERPVEPRPVPPDVSEL